MNEALIHAIHFAVRSEIDAAERTRLTSLAEALRGPTRGPSPAEFVALADVSEHLRGAL